MAQRVKRLPQMRETRVRSLGREDPLEKEMVTQSSILAWEIPWKGAWRATVQGVAKELATTERINSSSTLSLGSLSERMSNISSWLSFTPENLQKLLENLQENLEETFRNLSTWFHHLVIPKYLEKLSSFHSFITLL